MKTDIITTPARRRWARHIVEHGLQDLARRCWEPGTCARLTQPVAPGNLPSTVSCNMCAGARRARPFIGLLWEMEIIDQFSFEVEGFAFDLIDPVMADGDTGAIAPSAASAHRALPLFVAGKNWNVFWRELVNLGLVDAAAAIARAQRPPNRGATP